MFLSFVTSELLDFKRRYRNIWNVIRRDPWHSDDNTDTITAHHTVQ